MSHTKGPWFVDGCARTTKDNSYDYSEIRFGNRSGLFEVTIRTERPVSSIGEVMDNATLAVAAPDLLEALEERIALLDKMRSTKMTIHSDYFGQSIHDNEQKMRAAIAKAKGLKP